MLFSSTMPHEIFNMAKMYMKLPVQIEVAPSGTTAEKVTQEIFIVQPNEKTSLTKNILEQYKGSVLIFTRTKYGAKKLNRAVQEMGYNGSRTPFEPFTEPAQRSIVRIQTGKI
jgi:ATP-dependent RNA helicase RhlE